MILLFNFQRHIVNKQREQSKDGGWLKKKATHFTKWLLKSLIFSCPYFNIHLKLYFAYD